MIQKKLKIGITCYPTFGGSGVIATEIGMAMAQRGHSVHFICASVPMRLNRFMDNIYFHEVETRDYPLFISSQYALSLASKIVEVATYEKLDILHAHYAVPHATSAYLAKQILKDQSLKVITTLHGTDITLVGNDRSFLPITRFSIEQSNGVTAPSRFLKLATYDKLNVSTNFPIEVIPNFVDTDSFSPKCPSEPCQLPKRFKKDSERILIHVSNFRAVKRVLDVVQIFNLVQKDVPAKLVFVGDGPDRSAAEALVHELKIADKVLFLGKLESFVDILRSSDVFILPSESESFGLAALEAMSCGVPVVGSNVAGIPEVVTNNKTGFLHPVADVSAMAQSVIEILTDKKLYNDLSINARNDSINRFSKDNIIDKYESYYSSLC